MDSFTKAQREILQQRLMDVLEESLDAVISDMIDSEIERSSVPRKKASDTVLTRLESDKLAKRALIRAAVPIMVREHRGKILAALSSAGAAASVTANYEELSEPLSDLLESLLG